MAEGQSLPIAHNEAASRFEVEIAGQRAIAEYRLAGDTITFTHTLVPAELTGRGVASALIAAGLEFARERQLKVIPRCSFVSAYMRRHPDTQDLLAAEGRRLLTN